MKHFINVLRAGLLCNAAVLATAFPTQAMAQDAEETRGITDIIVTAQKREQNLQDVPIAVTALTGDALRTNRITNVLDLNAMAPNLSIRATAGGINTPNFMLRGSVSFSAVPGQDRSVAQYLDGIYLGSPYGGAFELPDIERIEVLRGPQGTLFGRNSTAGAISIVTREPSGEFHATQTLTYGNYNQFRSSTRVETPTFGPFSASISYTHDERDGDIKNLGAGRVWDRSAGDVRDPIVTSPKRLGDKNTETIFAAVKFESGDFKTVYRFDYSQNDFTPEGVGTVVLNFGSLNNPLAPAAFGDAVAAAFAANPSPLATIHRPKAINNSFTTPGYARNQGHSLTTNWTISDSLSLKNILGYRKGFLETQSDLTGLGTMVVTAGLADTFAALAGYPSGSFDMLIGAPFVAGGSVVQSRDSQWSDELQLNYVSDYLALTVGGLYYNQRATAGQPDGLNGLVFLSPVLGGVIPGGVKKFNVNRTRSIAGYVQAEVHVTPTLDVVGGFRVTSDNKKSVSYVNEGAGQFVFPASYKDTRSTYLLGVNFKPTQDLLLYAKYSTGFVSGGNLSGISFAAETVKSWEAGVKSEFLDRRVRANIALFHTKYSDLQAATFGTFLTPPQPLLGAVITREGDLTAKGIEAELTLLPVDGLTLGASMGYLNTSFSNLNPIVHRPSDATTSRPKITSTLSGQYVTQPIFGESTVMLRLDANYRSKIRTLRQRNLPAGFDPILSTRSQWVVNGRLALQNIELAGAKAELALWARNLTDNDNVSQPLGFGYLGSTPWERARTFGVDVRIEM